MIRRRCTARLGVRHAINVSGTTTAYGGTKLRREVMEAMNSAASVLVDVHELNARAGEIIADIVGAEAAFVSSGSAGGLVPASGGRDGGEGPGEDGAAPGHDGDEERDRHPELPALPRTIRRTGPRGAKLVGVGEGRRCHLWQLEAAYNEHTAAVAYLFAPFYSRKALTLPEVVESAHARGIPVIVDAASTLPPRANLSAALEQGADMVILSGGKGVRGPQGTGIPGREEGPDRGGGGQRQPQPVHRPQHEGREGGDRGPRRSPSDIRRGGRGGRDRALHGGVPEGRGRADRGARGWRCR